MAFEKLWFYNTVILQIFGVVLFSVFSVVNGFTEIKKTPKCKKHIERSRQHPPTPKFKRNRTLRDHSHRNFNAPKICKITVTKKYRPLCQLHQSLKLDTNSSCISSAFEIAEDFLHRDVKLQLHFQVEYPQPGDRVADLGCIQQISESAAQQQSSQGPYLDMM